MIKETPKPTLLVALGGNALIRKGEEGTVPQQFKNLAIPDGQTFPEIADHYYPWERPSGG